MAKFAKWIGGGLGLVMGGPIGALIGFTLGALFDGKENAFIRSQRKTAEADFKMSLLVLIACVMKVDGEPKKSQLDVVKRFLMVNFGEQGALDALKILKELLSREINALEMAKQINIRMNYSSKLELLHLLFHIAYADGEITPKELNLLQHISAALGISTLDFNSIRAPYTKTKDANWTYKVLEIEPTATNDEIKKAYRKMAMKYHPDKLNSLGEEVKKAGEEKFKSVKDAYDLLKKQRGFG